jgi:hypothetical protein
MSVVFDGVAHRLRTQQEGAVNLVGMGRQSKNTGGVSREAGWTSQNKITGTGNGRHVSAIMKRVRNPESVREKEEWR